jgi:ATP-dependent RNA helicase DDX51/DBP6
MLIDILITTPGRLAEHILHTPGFTLQHLQFLVLDEADRLLHQSFQNWIEVVMREISSPKALDTPLDIQEYIHSDKELPIIGQRHIGSIFKRRFSSTRKVRKLILSATMTYDIGKLTSLQLHSPEIISIRAAPQISSAAEKTGDDAVFSVPETLHEYAVKTTDEKPLFLLYLLDKYRLQKKTLIFTHSTETATRLNHFLTESYKSSNSDVTSAVISSEVPLKSRKKLLSSFISGKLNMYFPYRLELM